VNVSYLTTLAIFIFMLSPVLVPAVISGFHFIAQRRAKA